MTDPRIVLVGPSSGGRTSVGSELAEAMGVTFVETEDVLEQIHGLPFARLALELDGEHLKEAIAEASLRVLDEDAVVSLVPSALEIPEVRERMTELRGSSVPLVAVTAELSVLARRVGLNVPRSAALGQPRKWFRDFVVAQREGYLDLGASEFDTGACLPGQVARQVIREFALQ